ncbi:MAG: hypothetical protein KKH40_02140 [Nanoarchaeota archaeon]|nr:hypothetical protein [Nanoarchaeota archaeon]
MLKINISFAKLHEKSKYIFRIDVSEQNKTKDVCEILLNMAKDPVFIGYPYGLIETDGVARVSNREKEYLKTKLMVYFKRDQQKIKDCISSQDAHDILDNIS